MSLNPHPCVPATPQRLPPGGETEAPGPMTHVPQQPRAEESRDAAREEGPGHGAPLWGQAGCRQGAAALPDPPLASPPTTEPRGVQEPSALPGTELADHPAPAR